MNPLEIFEKEVKTLLNNALEKLSLKTGIVLETPPEGKGDFAFACFPLSKTAKKGPDKIAEDIVKNIGKTESIEKVENIGAYVNFYVDNEKLKEIMGDTGLDADDAVELKDDL
ncbi:MAG: hypothetical protein L6265_03465 [Thermoplasmatales archaeon]|nr:hypothetical protein [Thermoplasmatales archaeon]